jgi:error-prone DNA polymerase
MTYRSTVMGARLMLVRGRVQRHNDIIHVIPDHLEDKTAWLDLLSADLSQPSSAADANETARLAGDRPAGRHPRNERVIPKSRDFH